MLIISKLGNKVLLVTFLLLSFCQVKAQKGKLFIIGGGSRSPELIQSLIKTADMAEKDYMVVLPMSSAEAGGLL